MKKYVLISSYRDDIPQWGGFTILARSFDDAEILAHCAGYEYEEIAELIETIEWR